MIKYRFHKGIILSFINTAVTFPGVPLPFLKLKTMQTTQKTLKDYYTLTQLTQVLKVSYPTLAQRVEDGEIPFVKSPITDRKYFDKEVIHQMFNIQN